MPVIVIGADADVGGPIIEALVGRSGQVRAFVSDEQVAGRLRERGVHVALGDVSDVSHVEAACTRTFSAVLVTAAATDGRERSFAADAEAVLAGWGAALRASAVTRAIWVVAGDLEGWEPPASAPESVVLDAGRPDLAAEVARLDDAAELPIADSL
jgi:putative NADH-flavin reductase